MPYDLAMWHIWLAICALDKTNRFNNYSPTRSRIEYSPLFTEPGANSCFSIIFGSEYQELQNNVPNNIETQMQLLVCIRYAAVVLMISLHVHRF